VERSEDRIRQRSEKHAVSVLVQMLQSTNQPTVNRFMNIGIITRCKTPMTDTICGPHYNRLQCLTVIPVRNLSTCKADNYCIIIVKHYERQSDGD